jgi:hypothetical protein
MASESGGAAAPDADSVAADGARGDDAKDARPGGDRPAGAERDDQFADAAGDPLAGAVGGSASGSADQAYRTGVRTVLSAGPATVIGGGRFGDLIIGGTAVYLHGRQEQATGPVRAGMLAGLARRYVKVPGYDELVKRLTGARLLALRGIPGTGRATTSLSLLAEVTSGKVSRFGPDTDVRALSPADLQAGMGYLLDMAPGGLIPTDVHGDWLSGLLAENDSYMVLVLPHDARYRLAFGEYAADCPPPDAQAVLGRTIDCAAADRPGLADVMQATARDKRLGLPCRTMLPSEVLWLAGLIVAHAEGKITFDELAQGTAESIHGYVAGWFEPLADIPAGGEADDRVRLCAFRIALAVFNQIPFDLVAEAGELLAAELLTARAPRRSPGRQVFANQRDDYVTGSRARLIPGATQFGRASVASTCAAYSDERLPAAVLRQAWDVHNMRGPLITWLQSLSQDARPFVWMRAALALGLLSSWDFAYTFHQLIDSWAASSGDDPSRFRRRLVAAVALDAAARNDDAVPVVREVISSWCRHGGEERRWTAAAALGYDLGVRYAVKSLGDLRVAGCWQDGLLAPIASWAVARIFARGGIEPVLRALDDWLADSRRSMRALALLAVLRIADLRVSDLDELDLADGAGGRSRLRPAGRDRWPLLVALAAEYPALRDALADLVWRAARALHAQRLALGVLGRWMRAAEEDRTCAGPLGRFLALIGDDDSDRARLLHLLSVLRQDPDEPLPADIADRLEQAIERNIHIGDWQE